MTLYYYMYRSWQDCCRRGKNRSWPSVSVESVDSEYWCLNNAIVYTFIMRLTVESYLKTMSYGHCRQSFFEKFRGQAPVKSAIAKIIKKFRETGSLLDKNRNRQTSVWAETRAQSGEWYGSGTLHPGQILRGSLPLSK